MTGLETRRVAVTGGIAQVYLGGEESAPPLVLLHDGAWGGSSLVSWSGCLDALAAKFRIVMPDFLGFGESDKMTFFDRPQFAPRVKQVEEIVADLDIAEPVHVVGSSFGGSVALRLAAQSDVQLRSVTSVGGPGGFGRTALMNRELSHWNGTKEDLGRVLGFLMEGERFDEQLEARFVSASLPGHYRAVASAALPIPDVLRSRHPFPADPWPEALEGCDVPVNIIRGTRDELLDADWADRIGSLVTAGEVVELDALHSPNLDHPDEVVDVLLRLLG